MKSIILGIVAAAATLVITQAKAIEMPELAKKNGCTACHAIDKKVVGPAWAAVSARYKGAKTYRYSPTGSAATDAKEYPLVEGLMQKVSHGGKGNWSKETGDMVMIPNDADEKKQDQIKQLVEFVLSLANQNGP
ncbi:MAG: c-type cytochrome [Pseudomonadota bacterium]